MRHVMIGGDPVRFVVALILLPAGLALAGCSASGDDLPREGVSGYVTLDGQPVAEGSIQFSPAAGVVGVGDAVGGGSSIKSGKFSIDREVGLIPGKYRVSINAPAKATDTAKPASPTGGKGLTLPKEAIPKKYNAQTELTANIQKGGPNDLTFTLQSK
jgi:hypothetical protein